MRTLIRNTTVITVDASRRVFSPGAILIDGSTIVAVGADADLAQWDCDIDTVIDANGKVVLPGFVSAHNHLGYAVFRGRAEDIGYGPTQRLYLPMSTVISREERRDVGNLAIAELLRGGTTTVLEMEEDADVLAPFVEQVGMRAAMGIMTHDVDIERLIEGEVAFVPAECHRQLSQARTFAEQWHGRAEGRISAVMTANGLGTSSPALLQGLREVADRLSLRLSVHIGTGENDSVRAVHGMGSFDYAREYGFLSHDVIAVHCYRISDTDIQALAESGAHLAHCPHMNSFRGSIAPISDLRARGVNVGLGIDNYFSDYFDLIRSCIAAARIRAASPEVFPVVEAIELATIAPARALGLEQMVGSLECGKRADLQIINMRRFGLTPVNDPLQTLVYHAHAHDVETVMVDGRMVVREGQVVGVDHDALLEAAARAAGGAWSRFANRWGGYEAPWVNSPAS